MSEEEPPRGPRLALVGGTEVPVVAPPLSDLVAQLRAMADEIELGIRPARGGIFIIPPTENGEWPDIFSWGEVGPDTEVIGTLELAKTFFATCRTRRID